MLTNIGTTCITILNQSGRGHGHPMKLSRHYCIHITHFTKKHLPTHILFPKLSKLTVFGLAIGFLYITLRIRIAEKVKHKEEHIVTFKILKARQYRFDVNNKIYAFK